MNSSIPNRGRCGRFASAMRNAGRAFPAAVLAAVLSAGPALAVRPDTGQPPSGHPGAQGYSEHVGKRHLRKMMAEDLLEKGEQMRLDRLALNGEASGQVVRRLNARLSAGRGEVRVRSVQTDSKGNRHIRVHQYHRGYPVVGADAVIHVNAANEVYAVGGKLAQGLAPDAAPRLNADEARARAMAVVGRKAGARERQAPRLVIFDGVLAYETTVEEPGNPPQMWKTYVDASTGILLFRENRIIHAAPVGGAAHDVTGSVLAGEGGAAATISGWRDVNNFYFLRNNANLWGVYDQDVLDWSQNTTGNWGTADRAAVSLARNMELIQRYVSQVSLRNSYDDAGAFATAYVHEGTDYVNAYWDGFGFHFGDGDGITAGPLTVLDISAHEYGHAITQYTSNLTYSYESGALNES
jgi:Zn-dependent metalloprotease